MGGGPGGRGKAGRPSAAWALLAFTLAAAASLLVPALASAQVRAGAATVDASWHVGASAGQYAGDCVGEGDPTGGNCTFVDHQSGTFDPTGHTTRRRPSYGMQSRLSARALVVEGPDGNRVAIVKNDLYIPQDLLYRRTAQLLEQEGQCGIGRETLTIASSHDHSSPFYSSTSWGAWAFQDAFDVRFYEYMARRMFEAVEAACADLVPVRVGASVGQFDKTQRHSYGPEVGDDGTPAGFPQSNTDHDLTVVRFDDVSDPANPKPLANLVNFSLHPEFLEGNDLISADYLGPLERMTDRATGALTIWTQGAVGTSEPERSTYHDVSERLEFSHRNYAQAEYGARLMSDAIIDTWEGIGEGEPTAEGPFVPFDTDFVVESDDRWYPGPFSHPYPGVSNCRADKGLSGNPQLPIVGLPDCSGVASGLDDISDLLGLPPPEETLPGADPGLSTDDFQEAGIPVPENYSAPSYTGLAEDIDVHLQVIRFGEILITACSCEQWFDQSENIETRTDTIVGNEHLGYDWGAECRPNDDGTYLPSGAGTGTWTCPDPRDPTATLGPLSDRAVKRMRAQVNNPANGWNNAENAASAESEPTDATEIKGNYTHDDRCGPSALEPGDEPCADGEVSPSAALGYQLTIPVGMANDYNGYIATYREYQRGDHYRKALTAWGPHSSDYMATRLVTMARQLKQPSLVLPLDQRQEALLAAKAEADTAVNDQRAQALGQTGGAAIAAYEAGLPDDGGEAGPVTQPEDVERFEAAYFTWIGGSNFTDDPVVRVERLSGTEWEPWADQSGELPVTLKFPQGTDVAAYTQGDQVWEWTAHFEAFVSAFGLGDRPRATPPGSYRFVVDGQRREGGAVVPYSVTSDTFEVAPWSGITVEDLKREPDGRVSFRVGPRSVRTVDENEGGPGPALEDPIGPIDYPDSYESPARFIRNEQSVVRNPNAPADPEALEWFCTTCSFRPWLDEGDAAAARVTFTAAGGATVTVPASREGDRWVTERTLNPGESAVVAAGGVSDGWGNFNGAAAGPLSLPGPDPEPGRCGPLLRGTDGADEIAGTGVAEDLVGGSGDDVLRGRGGADCIDGGDGGDRILGGGAGDSIADGRGSDRVAAGPGGDDVTLGRGRDRLAAGGGGDRIDSRGRGRDRVRCGGGKDVARVGSIDVVAGDCERVRRGR